MSDPRFKLQTASRTQCKASIMIQGLPGRGKSGLALALGYVLAGKEWGKVGAVDTENKSLSLYPGIPCSLGGSYGHFIVGQLTPDIGFAPTNYIAFRNEMKKAGLDVCIKDSVSHAWQYKGGVLDLVATAKTKNAHYAKDKYAAWGDEDVVREKNELLQLIRDPDIHVITTVRVKEKMDYGEDEKGNTKLISLGEQQIQQADLKYEPDLVLEMIEPGSKNKHPKVRVVKTRYAFLNLDEEYEFTPALMEQLKDYLETGADPEELLEMQRQDYIVGVKEFLDSKPNYVPIWSELKKQAQHEETALEELPLDVLKSLFIQIIS